MLEEPTRDEIIRDILAGMRDVQSNVQALRDSHERFVLKEIYEINREADQRRIDALEAKDKEHDDRDKARVRMAYSAFVLPLLVILIAYAMGVRS